MTALWLTLIALLGIASLIVFLPLLNHRKQTAVASDQQQQNIAIFKDRLAELANEQAQGTVEPAAFLLLKTELEKALLADVADVENHTFAPVAITGTHWLLVGSCVVFMVLISLAMYVQLGRSEDFAQSLVLQAQAQQQAANDKQAQAKLLKLIDLLKDKIAKNPTDIEKWHLLANSYASMGQYAQAAQTYQAAMNALGKNHPHYAVLKGAFAQMLFQAADEQITPAVAQAVKEALNIDPMESSALLLSGIDAYMHGDVQQAIVYWQKSKVKANENLITQFIDPIIAQAQMQLAQMPTPAKTAMSNAKITVKVSLDNSLKNKTNPEQTVFVFARPVGGKMPLAIERLQVKDLPSTVVLDDSKAAMPTAVLSSVSDVQITARVSVSGQAREGKGDLFAAPLQVQVSSEGKTVELVINQQVE